MLRDILSSHSNITILPTGLSFFHYFGADYDKRGGYAENAAWFLSSCRKNEKLKLTKLAEGKNRRDLFVNIAEGYRKTHFPQKKYVGVYNHYIENHSDTILEWFPDMRYIQLIRRPCDNYASILATKNVSYLMRLKGFVVNFCKKWNKSTSIGTNLSLKYPNRCKVYSFEDFKRNPAYYLKDICKWLALAYKEMPAPNRIINRKVCFIEKKIIEKLCIRR